MLSDWALNTFMVLCGQTILTFGLVKMLRLRHLAIVWLTATLPCPITGYLNTYPVDPQLKVIWSVVVFVVTVGEYWAFSPLKPARRLVIISCCIAAAMIVEFPLAAICCSQGFNIDEISTFTHSRLDVYVFFVAIHSALMIIFLLLIYGFVSRAFSEGNEWGGMKVALLPTAQLCLVLVISFAERELVKQDESFILSTALLSIIVVASYAFFYLIIRRWHNAELQEARAESLREKSQQVFRQTEGFLDETERLAKLRHDFKNQLQVIEFLNADGKREQALDKLGRLEAAVEQRVVRS